MGFDSFPRARAAAESGPAPVEEAVLNLPHGLRALGPEQQARFEDLMGSVIPWRGSGYVLGVNGLFKTVPEELTQEIRRYAYEEQGANTREALLEPLRQIAEDRGLYKMGGEDLQAFR